MTLAKESNTILRLRRKLKRRLRAESKDLRQSFRKKISAIIRHRFSQPHSSETPLKKTLAQEQPPPPSRKTTRSRRVKTLRKSKRFSSLTKQTLLNTQSS